ncbi:MAG: hypothetical protein OXC72_07360, partial [Roseovarius sp.]|nr:hypothetical protein [Roseovarius sp.]
MNSKMRMARVKIQRLALKRLDERRKVFFQMASGKKFKLFCFNGWRHFNGFEFVQGGNIMGGGRLLVPFFGFVRIRRKNGNPYEG